MLFTRWPTRNGSESTQLNPFDRKTGFNAWDVNIPRDKEKLMWNEESGSFVSTFRWKARGAPNSNLEATASLISASALTRFNNSTSKASVGWCKCLCDRLQLWEGKCILLWQWPLFYKPQALEKVVVWKKQFVRFSLPLQSHSAEWSTPLVCESSNALMPSAASLLWGL